MLTSLRSDTEMDRPEATFGLQLNYTMGESIDEAFKWNEGPSLTSVSDRRYEKVRRENEIRVQERQRLSRTAQVTFTAGANTFSNSDSSGSVSTGQSIAFGTSINAADTAGAAVTLRFGTGAILDIGQDSVVLIEGDAITLVSGILQYTSASGAITNLIVPNASIELLGTDVDVRVDGALVTFRVRDGAANIKDETGTTRVEQTQIAQSINGDALAPQIITAGANYDLHVEEAHTKLSLTGNQNTTNNAAPYSPSATAITGTFNIGQTLNFAVPFTKAVTAAGGPITLDITVGAATRSAAFTSGSGTQTLNFAYTIQAADTGASDVSAERIVLNGGTLTSAAGLNAVLEVSGTQNGTINGAPVIATNNGLVLLEGATSTIAQSALLATDETDGAANLTYNITTATANGRVESSANPGAAITSFTQQDINDGLIRYVHDGSETIADRLIFTVQDSVPNFSAAETFSITVNAVNDLPTSADNTISTDEDTNHVFAASEFPFTDVDAGNTLQSVRIDTLPGNGTLFVDLNDDTINDGGAEAITAGDNIAVSNINADRLIYIPPANLSGAGADSFTFSVSDGMAFAASPSTMTIDIAAVNDAPGFTIGADQSGSIGDGAQTVNGFINTASFTTGGGADEAGQSIADFIVSEAADASNVVTGVDIANNGDLSFTIDASNTGTATINVQVQDDGGTASGGIDTSAIQTFTITSTLNSSSAVAVYSLRAVGGGDPNVVRVRRSTDDAEANFTASDITDGTLLEHVVPTDVQALYNNAMYFDGVNDYIDTSMSNGQVFNAFTVAAKIVGTEIAGRFVSNRNSSGNGFILRTANSGQDIELVVDTTAGVVVLSYSGITPFREDDIVGVWDGTTARLYVDGVERDSTSISGTITTSSSLKIGASENTANFFFQGTVTNVRIFDTLLSPTQVSELYDSPAIGTELAAYAGEGNTNAGWVDTSGNNYNGTVNGSPSTFTGQGYDGLVRTWYNQAGTSHAEQTTPVNQPLIVKDGAAVTENGKPAIEFDGASNYLEVTDKAFDFLHKSSSSVFVVNKINALGANEASAILSTGGGSYASARVGYHLPIDNRNYAPFTNRGGVFVTNGGGYPINNSVNSRYADNTNMLITAITDPSDPVGAARSKHYINGASELSGNTGTSSASNDTAHTPLQIFAVDGGSMLSGAAQEILIYPSDQSASRAAIEADINAYYSIY